MTMLLHWLFFFFVAMGAKLLLALVTIYLLLPSDRRCNDCDGETLLLQMSRGGRFAARLLLRALQRRWCPHCGWEGLARTGRHPGSGPQVPTHSRTPTRH
ncbi:MAG: hypothetical protein M3418_08550 [Gemmatimonadota bacterium]|nr:hypothetical protein [Gemmatimonadota bacterium]